MHDSVANTQRVAYVATGDYSDYRYHGARLYSERAAMDSEYVFLVNLISVWRTAENTLNIHSFSLMNINGNIKFYDSWLNEGQTGD